MPDENKSMSFGAKLLKSLPESVRSRLGDAVSTIGEGLNLDPDKFRQQTKETFADWAGPGLAATLAAGGAGGLLTQRIRGESPAQRRRRVLRNMLTAGGLTAGAAGALGGLGIIRGSDQKTPGRTQLRDPWLWDNFGDEHGWAGYTADHFTTPLATRTDWQNTAGTAGALALGGVPAVWGDWMAKIDNKTFHQAAKDLQKMPGNEKMPYSKAYDDVTKANRSKIPGLGGGPGGRAERFNKAIHGKERYGFSNASANTHKLGRYARNSRWPLLAYTLLSAWRGAESAAGLPEPE